MEPQIYPEEIWNINCIKSDFTDFRNCSKRLAVRSTMGWLYVSQKREVNTSDRQNGRMQELKYWIENLYNPPAWHNCEIILCVEIFYLKSTRWWWFQPLPLENHWILPLGKYEYSLHISLINITLRKLWLFPIGSYISSLSHFCTNILFSFLSHLVLCSLNQVLHVKSSALVTCFLILTCW